MKKNSPMGVSQWREHGIKYGYWNYFKNDRWSFYYAIAFLILSVLLNLIQWSMYGYTVQTNEELKNEKYATHIQLLDCRDDVIHLIEDNGL